MQWTETDVLVIGGNPGGCAAAISAARMGLRVMLLEPSPTLGGMNANGTFGFDCATPQALSGIAEEIADWIKAHYARAATPDPLHLKRADLVWESPVAAAAWRALVDATPGLTAITRAVPTSVRMNGSAIAEVVWHRATDLMGNVDDSGEGQGVAPAVVVDAGYEADVTAWAGVPCRLGREPRSPLEPHAGKIYFSNHDASARDGYLAHSILPGSSGAGDDAIMAFASRLHCRLYDDASPQAAHRLTEPPPGYKPELYSWGPLGTDERGQPVWFNTLYVLVGGKFLLNRMVRGNNLVGPNREYVLAHPRDRQPLRQRFVDHALGFLYYVQNEGGLPQLGLAHDEFTDNGNIPYLVYVREARRMLGRATLCEADVNPWLSGDGLRPPHKPDAIAIADWTYESQACADVLEEGRHYPDGYITGRFTRAPYQVPYGCLLPIGVSNLLVSGGISATHIAAGAARCEGARIQMGIAAGLAAALAVQGRCEPAQVPLARLQREIIQRGGKLNYFADVESGHPWFEAIQWAALRGLVPPDELLAFRPDDAMRWGDFAQAIVTCLRLPISVTSLHFQGLSPRESSFRYAETLYDLGTRTGIDLFNVKQLADEDPMQEFLRIFPKAKLLRFEPQAAVGQGEAVGFLTRVVRALAIDASRPAPPDPIFGAAAGTSLPRGMACHWLMRCASLVQDPYA
jgi:hypothetical protein